MVQRRKHLINKYKKSGTINNSITKEKLKLITQSIRNDMLFNRVWSIEVCYGHWNNNREYQDTQLTWVGPPSAPQKVRRLSPSPTPNPITLRVSEWVRGPSITTANWAGVYSDSQPSKCVPGRWHGTRGNVTPPPKALVQSVLCFVFTYYKKHRVGVLTESEREVHETASSVWPSKSIPVSIPCTWNGETPFSQL